MMPAWERFKFEKDASNGMLVGPDGCHYDTEAEAVYYGQIKFCGCSSPEEQHEFVLDCLASFDRDKLGWEGDVGIDRVKRLVSENPEQAAYFIAYALDNMELTEHGGSIGGAWVSARGKQAIEIGVMKERDPS